MGVIGKCVLNIVRYVRAKRVVGDMYMTGCTSCSISVCMKLLVRRGTSWHKGVVIKVQTVVVGQKCR